MKATDSTSKFSWTSRHTLWGLLLVALGLRIWGAWAYRYITDPDSSVVALMAKHMAEGTAFPVFFYGQNYMGSLEPMLSALMVMLWGATGFAVCLGPALMSVFALWMWQVYARDLGDRFSANAGIALCVIGPLCFFVFQFAPRGGYMVALFFCAYLLWSASRIAAALWNGQPLQIHHLFCMGLVAGLSLWSNMITVSAIFSACLVLLWGMKGKFWRYPLGILAGVCGTLSGILPWLRYNVQHHWDSLKVVRNLDARSFPEGIYYLRLRWIDMFEWDDTHPGLLFLIILGYALLLLAGLFKMQKRLRATPGLQRVHFAWLALLGFLGFSTGLFIFSEYVTMHTGRYLIPVVPALAVIAGNAFWQGMPKKQGLLWGGIAMLVLCSQLPILKAVDAHADAVDAKVAGQELIVASIQKTGSTDFYADIKHYFLNFMTGEAYRFSSGLNVFLDTISAEVEFSENPAVFKNYRGVSQFCQVSGGQAEEISFPGGSLYYNFRPPRAALAPVSPRQIKSMRVDQDVTTKLTDLDMTTGSGYEPDADHFILTVEFTEALPLRQIQLQCKSSPFLEDGERADLFSLDMQTPGVTGWQPVCENTPLTPYFWSGPRFYITGRRHRLEMALDATPVTALRLRIQAPPNDRFTDTEILEVAYFTDAGPSPQSEEEAFPDLLTQLKDLGLHNIYADRWVSNQLYLSAPGAFAVELLPATHLNGGLAADGEIVWHPLNGFLLRNENVPATLRVLDIWGAEVTRVPVGPWTLLIPQEEKSDSGSLYWTGYGLRFNKVDL